MPSHKSCAGQNKQKGMKTAAMSCEDRDLCGSEPSVPHSEAGHAKDRLKHEVVKNVLKMRYRSIFFLLLNSYQMPLERFLNPKSVTINATDGICVQRF